MMAISLKQKIYEYYLRLVDEKVNLLQQVLNDLKESGANETKSTAGDKHETALAMLQIEQANKRKQMVELLNQKAALNKINPVLSASVIVNGSLIKTNHGHFFISIALGKAVIEAHAVIALSPQSPLGQKLMGLKTGDTIAMNETVYTIENIE